MTVFRQGWLGAVLVTALAGWGAAERAAAAPLPEVLRVDQPTVRDAAQDGTGRVWGWGGERRLYAWTGTEWKDAPLPAAVPDRARQLRAFGSGADGAVYGLWMTADGNPPSWVVRCRGDEPVRVLVVDAPLPKEPRLCATAAGAVWITGAGPDVLRIGPKPEDKLAYSVAPGQIMDRGGRQDPARPMAPLRVTSDGRGRDWIWADGNQSQNRRLRGLIVCEGGAFTHYPTLPGLPDDAVFSAVTPKDADTLFVVANRQEVYELNTRYLNASMAPVHPLQLLPGFAWFQSRPAAASGAYETEAVSRNGQIWICRDGQWRQAATVDAAGYFDTRNLGVLATRDGLWFTGMAASIIRLPSEGGRPDVVGWRQGLSLSGINRVFELSDQRLLMVATAGSGRGALSVSPDYLKKPLTLPAGMQVLTNVQKLVRGPDGRVWKLGAGSTGRSNELQEWDGAAWKTLEPDGGERVNGSFFLVPDSRGRLWCLGESRRNLLLIYNPANGSWKRYGEKDRWDDAFADALVAEGKKGELLEVGQKVGMGNAFTAMPYGALHPSGRAVCLTEGRALRVYNGTEWRRWRFAEIAGRDSLPLRGLPFFSPEGDPCVAFREGPAFRLKDGKSWEALPAAATPPPGADGADDEDAAARAVPKGCVTDSPDSRVYDNDGVCWLTWKGALYKAVDGVCIPWFADGSAHPFVDGRRLNGACMDSRGGVFLETMGFVREWVYLPPRSQPPQTTVRLERVEEGTAVLVLGTAGGAAKLYRWRLDGGAWSLPAAATTITLENLARSRHRFEAAAVDENLQRDPTPAAVDIDIQYDPAARMGRLVTLLADRDYAVRERASRALTACGRDALPLLKKARAESTDADKNWWIDAVIQQIERRAAPVPAPPP